MVLNKTANYVLLASLHPFISMVKISKPSTPFTLVKWKPCLLFKLDIVLKQLVKMAPKNNKPSKINNQSKIIKKGECIKEIYQANRLENIIKKYNSLNNPRITFREFNHVISCKIPLYPLEILI